MSAAARLLVLVALAVTACDDKGDAETPSPTEPVADAHPEAEALAKLDERLHTLEVRLSKLEVATPAAASVPDHTEEIDALNKRVDALTNTLGTLDESLTKLQGEVETGGEAKTTAAPVLTGGEAKSAAAPVLTGVPEYIENYRACIDEKMPAAAREASKKALESAVDAWKQAAGTPAGREGLAQACKTATEAVKSACGW